MSLKFPAIPQPTADVDSLLDATMALKQSTEILVGSIGTNKANAAVTWSDLVNLGLITASQIPLARP